MSLLSRAAETLIPLADVCAQAGYSPDCVGQRNLRRQMRRKGFEVQRVGTAFAVSVAVWQAYLKQSAADYADYQAECAARMRARRADRRAGNGLAAD